MNLNELKHLNVKGRYSFHCIPFQVNIIKKPLYRQDWKMGKAEEERLAITVEKYQFLVDKVISAFHNKTEKKNAWEKVKNDLGFEPDEAAKSDFTSLQTKYLRRKKTLKDSNS